MGSGQCAIMMARVRYYTIIIIRRRLPCLRIHINIPYFQNGRKKYEGEAIFINTAGVLCEYRCVRQCFVGSRWPDQVLGTSGCSENFAYLISRDILLHKSSLQLNQHIEVPSQSRELFYFVSLLAWSQAEHKWSLWAMLPGSSFTAYWLYDLGKLVISPYLIILMYKDYCTSLYVCNKLHLEGFCEDKIS